MKKIELKKTYTAPVVEIVVTEFPPVMYNTSIPEGKEGEEGGDAESKKMLFDWDNGGNFSHNIWED